MVDGATLSSPLLALMSILSILGAVTATQPSVTSEAPDLQFPYYTLNANPETLTVVQGSTVQAEITITSLNQFSASTQCGSAWWGHLYISANVYPSTTFGVSAVVNSSCLTLKPGETANATLVVRAASLAVPGIYNVSVGVRFQVSPSGWSTGRSTTILVTVASDVRLQTNLGVLLTEGAITAAVIAGLILVAKRVRFGKRDGDSEAL